MNLTVGARSWTWKSFIALACLSGSSFSSVALAQDVERGARVVTEEVRERELVNEVPLTGTLSAARIATLSAEVAGLISSLEVDIGDKLEAGDTLLELNPELAEIALQRARAATSSVRERVADSERRLSEAQALGSRNIAASEIRTRQSLVEVERAALAVAEAEIRQREAELRRHKVTVPFPGTLSQKLVEIGEWVDPGTGLLQIISTAPLRADFQVPQRFYPMIQKDAAVTLRFDAYPDQSFSGQVAHTVPQSSDSARTFLLRVALNEDSSPPMLIAGMSVDATLRLANGERGVVVNRDALLRYPDGRVTTWVIKRAGEDNSATVTERQVQPGLSFDGQVEIISGLETGLEVVTRGNEALREDQQVNIIDSER